MPPLKQRINTPGGRNASGSGMRLNLTKKRPGHQSMLGQASKNKSLMCGKMKRRSSHLRRNNIALAKALNSSKQQVAQLTTLLMEYRERTHAAERVAQQFKHFRLDLHALLSQYSEEQAVQETSGSDSSRGSVLQSSLPTTKENESFHNNTGFKEPRTQLVNPMVQGLSINKVKVRLERINDVLPARRSPVLEQTPSSVTNRHVPVQDISLSSSPNLEAEVHLPNDSRSPADDDITMQLNVVPDVRRAMETFSSGLRVPSLTLQRLSIQDIQRSNSAAYMTESISDVSASDQSPQDQSCSVQLGQSMFPAEDDHISSRESAHQSVDSGQDAPRNSASPTNDDVPVNSGSENPLEGTSWMYTTNRLSRRIRVRSSQSLHQKSPKQKAVKRRYSVKNLAAKNNYSPEVYKDLSPSNDMALQDMSLTLCLPMTAINPRVVLETVKPPTVELHGDVLGVDVRVSIGGRSLNDSSASIGEKSPTVSVTRLYDADIVRMSAARNSSSSSGSLLCDAQKDLVPVSGLDSVVSETAGAGDSNLKMLPLPDTVNIAENSSCELIIDEDTAVGGTNQISGSQKKVSDTVKVVLKRVDDENNVEKLADKRRTRRTRKSIKASSVVRLPSRQAKKVVPGTYKEPSLMRKLRR